jgi:hypothetical protein|nr:hypothetical protein [Bacilli bacterium]
MNAWAKKEGDAPKGFLRMSVTLPSQKNGGKQEERRKVDKNYRGSGKYLAFRIPFFECFEFQTRMG